jgi:hypothetical protein
MHLLAMLPVIIKWIDEDKDLSFEDLAVLQKKYPEQYQAGLNMTAEEILEMNSRYRDSKLYGKLIATLLSERGVRWLKKNYSTLQEFRKSH